MGGSSGGGGSSGAVSYPEYMQTQHGSWLALVNACIGTAVTGENPYSSAVAYDPDCVLAATNYVLSLFYDEVLAMAPSTDWGTYYEIAAAKYTPETIAAISSWVYSLPTEYTFSASISAYSTSATATEYTFDSSILSANALAALVTAYQADLEARRDNNLKPAFKVGMLNVNSVMNSAFVLGDTLISAEVARNVAKFSGDLYFQNEQKKIDYENMKSQGKNQHNANIINYEQIKAGNANAHNANIVNYEQTKSGSLDTHNKTLANIYGFSEAAYANYNESVLKRETLRVGTIATERAYNAGVAEIIMSKDIQHLTLYQALGQLTTEANRIKIVAKGEENERNITFDKLDATWDLEMYQYGANMLASIAGATAATSGREPSTAQSVLGGAMSGAAMGSAIMPGMGTAIGAVAGGLAGLFG